MALLDQDKKTEARAKLVEATVGDAKLHLAWLRAWPTSTYEAGRLDDAMAEAEKCLAVKPNFTACLAVAAQCLQGEAATPPRFESYLAAYKTANPERPGDLYNDAVAYLNKGDDAAAKPILEKILEIDPEVRRRPFPARHGLPALRRERRRPRSCCTSSSRWRPTHRDAPTATEMLKYL